MKVTTGKTPITIMVLLAIWSLSLCVDLPGLAVTPIEGHLRSIFPDATDFKIQLLTVLPNLVIIPFVLLGGKLSESKYRLTAISAGTVMFLAAGVLSIFSSSLNILIALSCLLGAGCGLVLPFSTGLIADVFSGKYKVSQMGIVSAIGNIALVLATFAAGFLASRSWHLPFLVYLIPVLSLFLLPFLKKIPKADSELNENMSAQTSQPAKAPETTAIQSSDLRGGFYLRKTIPLLISYFLFVFLTVIPTYYLPNVTWIDAESASWMTSIFYLAMFVVGIFLSPTMRVLKKSTFIVAGCLMVGAFAMFIFTKSIGAYIIASAIAGLANGIGQPIFYTKATEIVANPAKSTLALAYVQTANYVAISIIPPVMSALTSIFHPHGTILGHSMATLFPFLVAAAISIPLLAVIIIRAKHFTFSISPKYYE